MWRGGDADFRSLAWLGLAAVAALSFLSVSHRSGASYVVGAKPFAEQYILAALIEQRLAASGLSATRRDGLGSAVIFDALVQGDIDIYVEYTGTLWANQMKRTDVLPRAAGARTGHPLGRRIPTA